MATASGLGRGVSVCASLKEQLNELVQGLAAGIVNDGLQSAGLEWGGAVVWDEARIGALHERKLDAAFSNRAAAQRARFAAVWARLATLDTDRRVRLLAVANPGRKTFWQEPFAVLGTGASLAPLVATSKAARLGVVEFEPKRFAGREPLPWEVTERLGAIALHAEFCPRIFGAVLAELVPTFKGDLEAFAAVPRIVGREAALEAA
jgi:hypothetical protein